MKQLASLKTLTQLDSIKTRVDDAEWIYRRVVQTDEAESDYTTVTDKGSGKLKPLENLEELRLDSAGVTDGVEEPKGFSRLKLLNLPHAGHRAGLSETKEALPGCQIIWDAIRLAHAARELTMLIVLLAFPAINPGRRAGSRVEACGRNSRYQRRGGARSF